MLYYALNSLSDLPDGTSESEGARLVLSKLLRLEYGEEKAASLMLRLTKTEEGRPYFQGEKDIYISLSHSGDVVAAALSDLPVGIDVEPLYRKVDAAKLAGRFFTPKEIAEYTEAPFRETFFKIWTKKEACFKACGGAGLLLGGKENSFECSRIIHDLFVCAGENYVVCVAMK